MNKTPQIRLRTNTNNGDANVASTGPTPPFEWKIAEPTKSAIEPEASPITNLAISTYIESSGMKVPFSPWMSISNGPGGSVNQIIHHRAGHIRTPTAIPLKPGI
jgi:hypothetical protein